MTAQQGDDLIITIGDVRRAGHCVSGARRWFEQQGLDFRDFLKHGIPAATMLATGDGQGRQVVERTMARRGRGEVLTMRDAKDAGQCVPGTREFLEANGIDFRDAVRDGVPVERLLATGDRRAAVVIRRTRRAAEGRPRG